MGWENLHIARILLLGNGDHMSFEASHGSIYAKAARNKNSAIVDLLLEKGASIEASNRCGETSLHWAAWDGNVAVSTTYRYM